jgi:hypothetical protein
MKRAIIAGFLLCSILLLRGQAWPPQKPILKEIPVAIGVDASPQWESVDDTQVWRLWKADRAIVYPQICVIKLSSARYLKFSQDPKAFMRFVNSNKVFSKDVILAGPWVSLSSVEQKDDPPDWVLTLVHGKMSTMIVSALPQLKLEVSSKE